MATQVDTSTKTTTTGSATLRLKGGDADQKQHSRDVSYIDHAMERGGVNVNWAASRAKETLDRFVPPEQSNAVAQRIQEFASANPKLAAFLAINLIFSGIPILLFAGFSISTFVLSIVTGLTMGLIGALILASTVVGTTLLFVVPFLLLTTFAATTLFFWTIVGLYIYSQLQQRNSMSDRTTLSRA